MTKDWAYLTKLTGDRHLTIEKVAIEGEDVAIEGHFELPPLAKLKAEDQVFMAVFVKSHGSIKQMEKHFGISYPTVKARLNRIGEQLDFVDVETVEVDIEEPQSETTEPRPSHSDLLDKIDKGEMSVDEVIASLNKGGRNE